MANTRRELKPGAAALIKVIIGLVALVGLLGILKVTGVIGRPHAAVASRQVATQINLPAVQDSDAGAQHFELGALPSNRPLAVTSGVQRIRYEGYAWNSKMGMNYSNGGPQTTEGSLMAREHVHLTIGRQDDNANLIAHLVACANELAGGAADCQYGVHFVSIMGDGSAMFIHALNEALQTATHRPDMVAEIVASAGYSRGEDKFMGPPSWRSNPQNARGGVVAGVARDGDWNIALDWAGKNAICFNPDMTTYDPDCLNWIGTNTYLEPVEKYNQGEHGYCESRPVVRHGRRTGENHDTCVQAVVTWTPGDVNVVNGRGGLVTLLSTRENSSQMPNAIIGLRPWNRTHRPALVGMITAIGLGGQAVMINPLALDVASQISHQIYNEQGTTPEYWLNMFRGQTRLDRSTNEQILLGGSKANNLADMMGVFGLNPGAPSIMEATYTAFGNLVHEQYPSELPSFAPFAQVVDTSYTREAAEHAVTAYGGASRGEVERVAFTTSPAAVQAAPVIATRDYNITFGTGSAQFTPAAMETLNTLLRGLTISANTLVGINGYTDNVGDPSLNRVLSTQRAQAVANWLRTQAPTMFPVERMTVRGFGQAEPTGDNATEAGRAQNRRVRIVIRQNVQ